MNTTFHVPPPTEKPFRVADRNQLPSLRQGKRQKWISASPVGALWHAQCPWDGGCGSPGAPQCRNAAAPAGLREQRGTSHHPHSDTALLAAQPNVNGSTNTL